MSDVKTIRIESASESIPGSRSYLVTFTEAGGNSRTIVISLIDDIETYRIERAKSSKESLTEEPKKVGDVYIDIMSTRENVRMLHEGRLKLIGTDAVWDQRIENAFFDFEAEQYMEQVLSKIGVPSDIINEWVEGKQNLKFDVETLSDDGYNKEVFHVLVRLDESSSISYASLPDHWDFVIKLSKKVGELNKRGELVKAGITESDFYGPIKINSYGKDIISETLTNSPAYVREDLVLYDEYIPGITLEKAIDTINDVDISSLPREAMEHVIIKDRKYFPSYFRNLPSNLDSVSTSLLVQTLEKFRINIMKEKGKLDGRLWKATVQKTYDNELLALMNVDGRAANVMNRGETLIYIDFRYPSKVQLEYMQTFPEFIETQFLMFTDPYLRYQGSLTDYLEGTKPYLGNEQTMTDLVLALRNRLLEKREIEAKGQIMDIDYVKMINEVDKFLEMEGINPIK